ncbi:hypothetical protein A2715_00640 [Candidatus Woesebacteria bacterium RIFCSPHIGHO2_01_FULL_39_32]|uniref:DUF305 domain-containing protein n=1 Tax=Candidatus Woesebacteria bacterium RIFCSPLOWO2_01_FULL_39_25 TaxID=1802521 RepID=A0A1F8BJ74_9BACT|nr:MAG: hypothetical protein A2124_03440 [Candidatus Woesebacteria bacterium GWB1_37_5]OGM24422.1 MAG: hypothetical protein A2715_00640 [Candidatus Woesebacteria bacterium RIFCSPHIGHO2_01_FULL_39_32]OGM35572.1 MAG: hypothetical protein A3F01_02635 [Candidatus Woesebacteria bacterium RIFCSPHIGHO2_12_FULL_38_11]OGM63729.1 MAG: hypothetical protein A2893_01980 [Candidatus Woesebacteria bacterium RIFCSPLOWO2_01_FULL_39_25]
MDKPLIYAIIGGLIGAVVALLVSGYSVNNQNYGMMRMMGMGRGGKIMMRDDECPMIEEEKRVGMEMSMGEMSENLEDLEGDEFDKTFIEIMTDHHEGAIEMAKLIPSRTDRAELTKLGEDIISAQSKEIEMMQDWSQEWFGE